MSRRKPIQPLLFISLIFVTLAYLWSCSNQNNHNTTTIKDIKELQSYLASDLEQHLTIAHNYTKKIYHTTNQDSMKLYYKEARKAFKYAEPLLAYTQRISYSFLDAPNILKVYEEDLTDIKIKEPTGFQVLEESIFVDATEFDVDAVQLTAKKTVDRLRLEKENIYLDKFQKHHFLWMLRDAFIRVGVTGIAGFDSPVLLESLKESQWVYESMIKYTKATKSYFNDQTLYSKWIAELEESIKALNGDFNTYDRYSFIKNHTQKQMQLWVAITKDWQVQFPFELAIKNDATSLFSSDTFNLIYFDDPQTTTTDSLKVALGQKLFNDNSLSTSGKMSCATCHDKSIAFTDALPKSKGQKRNSPTLTYAAIQHAFFYDGRAGSLEGQIVSVVENETEFHSDLDQITERVAAQESYQKAFKEVYSKEVNEANIRNAIATYIRVQQAFDSKFDRNMNGLENSLTASEINGFNVFMGKGKCGTCHFAPVFNGTVPPNFTDTEFEFIGVPEHPVFEDATIDPDLGRYHLFGVEERKFFFKTPTVRNAEKTAPYMHNGVYATLDQVMEFYNVGGGQGIGIENDLQTLPFDNLQLTDKEIKDVIAFLNSLTDQSIEKL